MDLRIFPVGDPVLRLILHLLQLMQLSWVDYVVFHIRSFYSNRVQQQQQRRRLLRDFVSHPREQLLNQGLLTPVHQAPIL